MRIRTIKPSDASTWADLTICQPGHHLLYRFYDDKSRLLYIGITWNPKERWKRHRKERPWWDQVAVATVECYPEEWLALNAELAAIKVENPQHNRRGKVA